MNLLYQRTKREKRISHLRFLSSVVVFAKDAFRSDKGVCVLNVQTEWEGEKVCPRLRQVDDVTG